MKGRRVVVAGAGFAGLAAALAAAARGSRVTLLEAEAQVGGKARAVQAAGARIDLGPTLLTDLDPLRGLCATIGARLEDTLDVVRLDPAFVASLDGRWVAWRTDRAGMLEELRELGPEAPADWMRFLALGARAQTLTRRYYVRGDVTGLRDLARLAFAGGLSVGDVAPFIRHRALDGLLESAVRTPSLRRLLAHFARFVGLEARQAPAVTLVIPYLLATSGVWYPRGGFAALAQALLALAESAGVVVRCRTRVTGLTFADGRVTGCVLHTGEHLPAEAVVAAVDVASTAEWLADATPRRPLPPPALGAHVAWWVVAGAPRDRVHHAFDFGSGAPGDEPLYVATPTVTDATLAPTDRTVVYALVHGPAGQPMPTDAPARWRARMERAGRWPEGAVLAAEIAPTPGSCYGYAIRPGLLGALPPSQRIRRLANLVLAGGSVFPGPGVANAIRSGLRAAELVAA